jgi:HAAS domain-containing protein
MSQQPDLIGDYLGELRAALQVTAEQAGLIVAEAEDHLREAAARGLAAGMTEREAQEAAISAFGSIGAVVRAHATRAAFIRGRAPAAVLGDLVLAGWKLAGTGLAAVGVSGLVVLLMNVVLGRGFTGQAPSGVSFHQADCAHWMALWPGARTCAGAQLLESSSDAVVLRVGAGVIGIALLVTYGVLRYAQRRRKRGPVAVLAGYFPLLAACVFGTGALGLALAQLTSFTVTDGPGTYLSGAIVAAGGTVWYGHKARPVIQHLLRGRVRYAGAR